MLCSLFPSVRTLPTYKWFTRPVASLIPPLSTWNWLLYPLFIALSSYPICYRASSGSAGKSKRKSLKPVKYEELDEDVEAAVSEAADNEVAMMQPVDFTIKKKRHHNRQQLESPTIDVGTEEPVVPGWASQLDPTPEYRVTTERGELSVARFCYVFPCELRRPAWAVGSYSISQSAGGTSKNIIFKTLWQIGHPTQ